MGAMKVFSSVIGYLKDHMWTSCENQSSGIQDSDITWVLTVPAIWNDSSKQFMREAAEKLTHHLEICKAILQETTLWRPLVLSTNTIFLNFK